MPIVLKGELCSMKLNRYDNFKQHTYSDEHTNGTDDAKSFPSAVFVSDDVPECSLCKVTFDSLKDFETHSFSLDHAQKVIEHNSLITVSSDMNSILSSPLKNLSVDEMDKQKQQEKNPSLSGRDSILLDTKVFKPPGLTYSCSYCIKEFTGPEPYKQHLDSKSHRKKVAFKNNSLAEIKKIDGHKYCDICKKEFTGAKPYNEHLISKKHRMMEHHFQFSEQNADEDSASKAKKIKIESMSDIDKQFYCEICEMPCSGFIPYFQHLAGKAHKKNEARSQAGVSIVSSINQLDSLHNNNNNNINYVNIAAKNCSHLACSENKKQSLQFFRENSDDDSVPKAKKVKIELDSENISDVSSTLEKIKIERKKKTEINESKPSWFCRICNVQSTGPIDYSQHLGGKGHRKKLYLCQKENNFNEAKDTKDFDGSKSDINGSPEESSFCSQEQNMCSENIDYHGELKKTVKMYSPDEEINFD